MGVSDPADCPYCCPNDGPVVTDGSCVAGQIAECAACGQCVDYVCSASCLAVPVGNTCECTQRSSLFPFCCPLSDGSGFYLPCTDGSAAGALSRNEDGVILTPSGCPLDCNCSLPDELLDCSAQSNCRGNGRCNVCTGTCDCFTGFTGQDCGLTTGGETANAAPCEALDFCSGVGVCCTNSSQYDGTQESAEACFSPPDQETPADDVCWCPPGTRAPNGDCQTGGDLTCGAAV